MGQNKISVDDQKILFLFECHALIIENSGTYLMQLTTESGKHAFLPHPFPQMDNV